MSQQGQPPQVPIGPVPIAFTLGQTETTEGKGLMVMQVSTPMGMTVYFLDPDQAVALGEAMVQQGKAARSGLTIASRLEVVGDAGPTP